MIIEDYRKMSITTEEFEKIFFSNNRERWNDLARKIESDEVDVSKVDINKLFNGDLDCLWTHYYWICPTFKNYLKKVNPEDIEKDVFSKLLTLEGEDEEYKEILKSIVDRTDKFNTMYFFDYEDNEYDADKTKDIIVEKVSYINREDLYCCYPSLLFKHNNFNPILITCLNSPNNWDVESYDKAEFRVILV